MQGEFTISLERAKKLKLKDLVDVTKLDKVTITRNVLEDYTEIVFEMLDGSYKQEEIEGSNIWYLDLIKEMEAFNKERENKKECENCDMKKIRDWIQSNGSDDLKFLAEKETCRSADILDLYEEERKIYDKKYLDEFNQLKSTIEKRNMSYTQLQYDRLFELRQTQSKIHNIGKIEDFIELLEENNLIEE